MLSKFFGSRDKAEQPSSPEKPHESADKIVANKPVPSQHAQVPVSTVRVPPRMDSADAAPGARVGFEPTVPLALPDLDLQELTPEERKIEALAVVELHHQRIANTIRTLWGYKECSVYINKLIMAGGDGMGHARVGFNQDAALAMLRLSDLHDAEFGPPDSIPGGLLSL